MIFRKKPRQAARKVHPLMGVLLFFISLVLLLVTGPLGFLYGIFHSLFTKGLRGLGEYLLQIAISIDQLGNVLMQHLLNLLWIRHGGYRFGNRDETISSALGRNRQLGTLTAFGKGIDTFLDFIDPNHSLNSIDYYIEPSRAIIERVAWIHIRQGQVLFLRLADDLYYFLPGGGRKAGESDAALLAGYLKVLLGIEGHTEKLVHFGTFESPYQWQLPTVFLRQHCYTMPFSGELAPAAGMEGLYWVSYGERNILSEPDRMIMEALHEQGLLS